MLEVVQLLRLFPIQHLLKSPLHRWMRKLPQALLVFPTLDHPVQMAQMLQQLLRLQMRRQLREARLWVRADWELQMQQEQDPVWPLGEAVQEERELQMPRLEAQVLEGLVNLPHQSPLGTSSIRTEY